MKVNEKVGDGIDSDEVEEVDEEVNENDVSSDIGDQITKWKTESGDSSKVDKVLKVKVKTDEPSGEGR